MTIERQAREQREQIERQVREQRERVERAAKEAQTRLRRQISEVERHAQAALASVREAERMEQRKRDLPITEPIDIRAKERIAEIEASRQTALAAGEKAKVEIEEAKAKDIAAVKAAEAKARTELEAAVRVAEREQKKAEAERAKARAKLKDFIKDDKLDLTAAVNAGFTKIEDYFGWDVTESDIDRALHPITITAEGVVVEGGKPIPISAIEKLGIMTITAEGIVIAGMPSKTEGEQAFNQLLIEGRISPDSRYVGYDEKTGEVEYEAPAPPLDYATIEEEFLALSNKDIHAYMMASETKPWMVPGVSLIPPKTLYKHFLPEDAKRDLLAYYVGKEVRPTITEILKPVLGMVPVVGTVMYWDEMSPTWRAISIALDVAILVPAARAGISALRGMRAPIRVGAANLAKMETKAANQMVLQLNKAYGKTVGSNYRAMIKAQTTYLKRLADVAELTRRGKSTTLAIRAAEKAERVLVDKARLFAGGIRYKPGFDSPAVAKMYNPEAFSHEMVLGTRSAIEGLSPKVNIKMLEQAVIKAESALKAAQAKWPTQPAKWSDLMFEHAIAQSKLAQAKIGGIQELYRKLLAARSAGKTELATELEAQIDKAIRSMEIEWGRGGMISLGKGGVAVAEPFAPTVAGVPVWSLAKPPTVLVPVVAGIVIAKIAVVSPYKTVTVTLPEFITLSASEIEARFGTKLNIYTEGEVIPAVEAMIWKSPAQMVAEAQAIAVEVYTEAAIQAATEAAIKAAAMNATAVEIKIAAETAAATQIKAITKTAVKTAVKTKVATKLKLKLRWKPKILIPPPLTAEAVAVRKKVYPDGTIVWRQGVFWKIIPPPYTLLKPISSRKPPAGVAVTKGTPQETLTFIGGVIPFADVAFDLGVVDGFIDVKNKRIVYTGYGLETDVGLRLPSPTKGLTLRYVRPVRKYRPRRKVREGTPARAGVIKIGPIKI